MRSIAPYGFYSRIRRILLSIDKIFLVFCIRKETYGTSVVYRQKSRSNEKHVETSFFFFCAFSMQYDIINDNEIAYLRNTRTLK